MLIASVDSAIAGHVNLIGDGLAAGLHRVRIGLGVEEAYRGRGVARNLMEAAIEWARHEPSIEWLELGVFVGNTIAETLAASANTRSEELKNEQLRRRSRRSCPIYRETVGLPFASRHHDAIRRSGRGCTDSRG